MNTSCIRHPRNEPINVYRQWQLRACSGSIPAAVLLSYFEDAHNSIAAGYELDKVIPPTILLKWQPKKKLAEETGFKPNEIAEAIAKLEELGFLIVGNSPNPLYFAVWLNVEAINNWLAEYEEGME